MQAWCLDHSRIFCISLCLPVWFCILFFTENQLFRAWYHPSKWEWLWRHRVGLFSAHSSKTRLQHSSSGMTEKKCTFSVGIGCRIFLIILMTAGMGMISLNCIPIYYEPLRVLRDIKLNPGPMPPTSLDMEIPWCGGTWSDYAQWMNKLKLDRFENDGGWTPHFSVQNKTLRNERL